LRKREQSLCLCLNVHTNSETQEYNNNNSKKQTNNCHIELVQTSQTRSGTMADNTNNNAQYTLATDEDFEKFVTYCESPEGWNVCYEKENVKVWDRKPDNDSAINIVKLHALLPEVDPWVLYDVLHDPDYRKVWDDNMIERYNICQLDPTNDIGYYSAKAPGIGISNRDFVNQRMWRVKDDNQWIIMNHSVIHTAAPEKKGFVRANSIRTGYMIKKAEKGCTLTYMTQTDPKGWIPAMIVNKVTKTFAPNIVGRLANVSKGYNEWKSKNNPDSKPWRNGKM